MFRRCIAYLTLVTLPLVGRASDAEKRTVIKLDVQAMPAATPALRYPLLPELREMNPGNPVQEYLNCFSEQQHFFFQKASFEDRERWLSMPLGDLPVAELRNYGSPALQRADYAARLDNPDWQILLRLKNEGARLLTPEMMQIRRLADALRVRWRAEVAERRFDDAFRTARTTFALARHMGEHPTQVGDLVAMAIAGGAIKVLDEMIEQPGCPNLYWSLTNLPGPFIDVRKGMQGDRAMTLAEFALFDTTEPMTPSQLEQAVKRLEQFFDGSEMKFGLWGPQSGPPLPAPTPPPAPKRTPREWLAARSQDKAFVAAARKRLVEVGMPHERVDKLPALQVVLLDEKREFDVECDNRMKWRGAGFWNLDAALKATPRKDPGRWLFSPLNSGEISVMRAQARLEQRIALLRHVEAIRMHAAEHGKLPARLAEIKVPLPVDPISGQPFAYQVEGRTATLRGSPPHGFEKAAAYNLQYEVTIRP